MGNSPKAIPKDRKITAILTGGMVDYVTKEGEENQDRIITHLLAGGHLVVEYQ